MDKKLTEKIKQDFDCIALLEEPEWNHNHHYHHFLIQQLPTPCGQVLEIGCGTGEFSRLLAKQSTQVLAVDLSSKMIEITSFPNFSTSVAAVFSPIPGKRSLDKYVINASVSVGISFW